MDYYSHYLEHYYYWLYCIYVPSDNEFVACVDRKKSYGTPLQVLHISLSKYQVVSRISKYGSFNMR